MGIDRVGTTFYTPRPDLTPLLGRGKTKLAKTPENLTKEINGGE